MQWLPWILAFVVSAAAGYWVYRADVRRAVPYPWLTALLRCLVIFFTILLLVAPAIVINKNETQKPVILFLQDESRSVANALGKDSTNYKTAATDLIEKLSDKYRVVTRGFGNTIQNDSLFGYRQQATDIAAALANAAEYYGVQNLGAIIMPSDGRYNQGTNPLYQPLSIKAPIYTVGIGDSSTPKDLRITQVYANKTVALNSRFEIRADVVATQCAGYNNSVTLTEAGSNLGSSNISINSNRYDRSVSFTVTAATAGLHHYTVSVPAADGEVNTANNRRDVFVEVIEEKKSILIAAAAPHPDVKAITAALSGLEAYKLTVKMADELPASYNDYDVVILHQLPSQIQRIPAALVVAKKPTWYILGSLSNPPLLNEIQTIARVNLNVAVPQNIFAAYNSGFNNFMLPANLQSVLDKMPPLSVPSGSIDASPAAINLFYQKGFSGQPALWFFQQGTTPAAMLAGEGLWRWRLYEYKNFNTHDVVDECIRQTVSFLAANVNDKPFRAQPTKYVWSDQEPIIFNAYLLNANNEQINTADAQLVVTNSKGEKQNFILERSGTSYRLNIGVREGGTYNYTATANHNGKSLTSSGNFAVESVPLELMETGADYPLLYNLAKKYNGSFVPADNIASLYDSISKNQQIKPVIQTTTDTVPLVDWKWFFFLILALAVTEWLLRKYWLAQ